MVTDQNDALHHVTSPDATPIAYWTSGVGPPLLLVHGSVSDHHRFATLLPRLTPHAQVHAMDRRGRGGSGDSDAYALEREVDDVVAVIEAAAIATGEPVNVYGHSLGAVFTLAAAARGAPVGRAVLYEPPIGLPPPPPDLADRLDALLAAGDQEGVVVDFFRAMLKMTDDELAAVRAHPGWPDRVAAAHTITRELRLEPRLDPRSAAAVTAPTLLLQGELSPPPFHDAAARLAAALPDSRVHVLPGQSHVADQREPEAFAQLLLDFLREGLPA